MFKRSQEQGGNYVVRAVGPSHAGTMIWASADPGGRLAATLEEMFTGNPVDSLTLALDEHGQSEVYFAPKANAYGLAKISGTAQVGAYSEYIASFISIDTDPLVEVYALNDGQAPRPVGHEGLALTADEHIKIEASNPYKYGMWLELMFKDEELALQSSDMRALDIGPDTVFPYRKEDSTYWAGNREYLAPGTSKVFELPVRPESDGSEINLLYFTDMNPFTTIRSYDKEKRVIENIEFTVGAIRLESIDLGRAGDEDIGLYNGMGGTVVPSVEWVRNVRERAPGKRQYENDTVAPTALVKGDELEMRVEYFCNGLDSFDLTMVCINPDGCHYLAGTDTINLPCSSYQQFQIFSDDNHPGEASMSLDTFYWRLHNASKGSNVLSLSTPIVLEQTVHRFYKLFDEPKDYSWWGEGMRDERPWIIPLEMSLGALSSPQGCDLGTISTEDKVRDCITYAVYHSSWKNYTNRLMFIDEIAAILYSKSPTPYVRMTSLDLTFFLQDIQNVKNPALCWPQGSGDCHLVLDADCYTINTFGSILIKSAGVSMYNILLVPIYYPDKLMFNMPIFVASPYEVNMPTHCCPVNLFRIGHNSM